MRKRPKDVITAWEATGIIRPAKPAASVACTDCGNLRRVHIEVDVHDVRHGYISCPECGIAEVDLDSLRRWAIVAEHVLGAVFQSSTATIRLSELVPGRLWRIGKAAWGGQTQELLFALCRRRDDADAVLQVLRKRPKSILFVPTETDAVEWSDEVPNAVVALDSVVSMRGTVLTFDGSYVQGLLAATDEGVVEPTAKPRRRSPRTAKIEALKKALIDHLRAANRRRGGDS